jgi:tRNA-binding EMAP/Myf-like protein
MSEKISIDDFAKVEISLGTVKEVSIVEGADKLYKLIVDFGLKRPEANSRPSDHQKDGLGLNEAEGSAPLPDHSEGGIKEERETRQILSAIREYVTPQDLLDKQFPFITNLEPRMIRGHESNGMILAGSDGESFALLSPTEVLKNGTKLR